MVLGVPGIERNLEMNEGHERGRCPHYNKHLKCSTSNDFQSIQQQFQAIRDENHTSNWHPSGGFRKAILGGSNDTNSEGKDEDSSHLKRANEYCTTNTSMEQQSPLSFRKIVKDCIQVPSPYHDRMAKLRLLLYLWQNLLLTYLAAAYTTLSEQSLRALPGPGDDFNIKTGKLLSPILRPRVPGTPGSIFVQNHFIDFFKSTLPKWNVELQNSTSKTPATGDKEIPFVNLIITRDPPWTTPGFSSRLTLVAHYDSKLTPAGFIGATDSAAPCAMIMHAARGIDAALTAKWEQMQADGLDLDFEDQQGVQILFLDGEEAFKLWTAQDSLYGSKSLAAELEATAYAAQSTFHNALSSISLFVLLDLLGAENPTVPSYFKTTHWAYKKMAELEKRLRSLSLFDSSSKGASKRDTLPFLTDLDKKDDRWLGGAIEDDHVPFMDRGVDILHLIPTPFPRVWHNREDDGDHLNLATVADWAKLITAFAAEWMELEGFLNTTHAASNRERDPRPLEARHVNGKSELVSLRGGNPGAVDGLGESAILREPVGQRKEQGLGVVDEAFEQQNFADRSLSRILVRTYAMAPNQTVPPLSDKSLFKQECYVNGEWVKAKSGKTFEVKDPGTGKLIGSCPECSKEDIDDAIKVAASAFPSFRKTTGRERARMLRKWYQLMVDNSEDIAKLITWENGKPFNDAKGEAAYAASFFEWFSEEAPRTNGDTIPATVPGNRVFTIKEPVGVCGLITPWNFPAAMITRKIGPALAAGCTVVAKSPGETPFTSLALAELAHRAGIPKGVVNFVTAMENTAEVGSALTSNPTVRKISFTGSTAVGKLLMNQSADTLKKLSFELGGNAPFIVFDDADLDVAVDGAVACKFRSSGQTCVCANRIYVQKGIYDKFAAAFAEKVKGFKVGGGYDEGVTHGPLIHDRAISKVDAHVRDAEKKGGKVIVGGQKMSDLGSNYFQPTVITGMTMDMQLASEETFGPVAGLFPFESEAEVVEMANKAEVGLAGYFYSRDLQRAYRVAEALEVGMVGINTGLVSDPAAPFGGVKHSGFGREGSRYGIEEYQITKMVTMGGMGEPLQGS
ncbi:MAG: hypothetical protein Q9170_006916 [Blastenia crenularia]